MLKSEPGALPSSRAKRRRLGWTDVSDGGGVRAIFTRRMMQPLWERTPEPWWLITADGGKRRKEEGGGGESNSPAASPAGAALTAGPHAASCRSACRREPPRHDDSSDSNRGTVDPKPLDGGVFFFRTGFSEAAERPGSVRVVRLFSSPVPPRLSPAGTEVLDYIISASEATSSNS